MSVCYRVTSGIKRNVTFQVAKHTYTSYPEEFDSPIAAERFCAEEALKDLIPKYGKKWLLLANDKDILERIPPMLQKHHHGKLKDVILFFLSILTSTFFVHRNLGVAVAARLRGQIQRTAAGRLVEDHRQQPLHPSGEMPG